MHLDIWMGYTSLGYILTDSTGLDCTWTDSKHLSYTLACTVARGLKMKSFWIDLYSSNFPCVTQTKRLRPSEMTLEVFFIEAQAHTFAVNFFPPNFQSRFFRPFQTFKFCW